MSARKLKLVCHDLVSKRARLMNSRKWGLHNVRENLPSCSDRTGDREPTGKRRHARIGVVPAYQNANHGDASREHRSRKGRTSERREQSAEREQWEGRGMRETDRQDTNVRSVFQGTHRKPLPPTINNNKELEILPIQVSRLSSEVSLSNRQISAKQDPMSPPQTQTTNVTGMYKTSQGEEAPVPKSQGTEIRPSTRDGSDHNEAMDRIFNELLKIQKEFPSMRFEREITYPCSLSDVETALVNVVQAYDHSLRIVNTNEEEIQKMRQQYQTLQSMYNDDLDWRSKEYDEKILSLKRGNEKDKSHLEGKISVYEKQQKQHDDRIRRLQREHEEIVIEKDKSHLKDKISVYEKQQQQHDVRIRCLQREHEEIVNEKIFQIQHMKGDLTLLRENHRGEINRLKEQQHEQLMVMRSEASAELARTTSRLKTQLLQAQTARTATTEHYEKQVQEMTNKHDDDDDDEKRQMEPRIEDQKSQIQEFLKQKKMVEEFQSKKRALEEDLRLAKIGFESQLRETKRQLDQEREGKAKEIETIQNAHDAKKKR
jgi:hypothetical protein